MGKRFASEPRDLVALQPPPPLKDTKTKDIVHAAEHYLERWRWIVSEFAAISQLECPFVCPRCGNEANYSGMPLWHRLTLVSGAYYEAAVRELILRRLEETGPLPPGLNLNSLDQFLKQFPRDAVLPEDVSVAHLVHVKYRIALVGAFFISPLRGLHGSPIQPFEESAHNGLLQLHNLRTRSKNSDYRRLLTSLTHGLIEILSAMYSVPHPAWNADHKLGPFSAIRLPELALLARRNEAVIKRYGVKNVESIYEQQLALIMQSFGFIVVRTRKGDRTVDLVCIAGDPNSSMTVLVEAKTTKRPYTLPTDDQRALIEYARDVRQNLTTLPSLSLVLIVAPSASNSIEPRLAHLESEAGVPVRLISAGDFAQLREFIAGPLRLPVFRNATLASPTRVLHGLPTIIAADSQKVAEAHEALVRACLPGAHEASRAQTHWDHEHAPTDSGSQSSK